MFNVRLFSYFGGIYGHQDTFTPAWVGWPKQQLNMELETRGLS